MKKVENKLIILGCGDKKNDEKWYAGRNLGNIPKPFRILLCASPNSGKSMLIKNFALKADPLFDRIVVVCCSKDTTDYDDLEPNIVLDKLPSLESFDRKKKNLLIIDDYKPKNNIDKAMLDRYFGFVSSHCNTCICMAVQDMFALNSPTIRRMCNIYVVWKGSDENQMMAIGRRIGLGSKGGAVLKQIFNDLDFQQHDSLMIDLTKDTPCKLRKNIYEKIDTKYIPDLP
jgi:hypothetical protein